MTRTKILCPECLKKHLLVHDDECWCDECGTEFILINDTTVKYK